MPLKKLYCFEQPPSICGLACLLGAPYLSDSDGSLMAAACLLLTSDPAELSRPAHTDCRVLYPPHSAQASSQVCAGFGALWCWCASSKIAGLPLAKLGGTCWGDLMGGLGPRLTSPETPPAFSSFSAPLQYSSTQPFFFSYRPTF